jgi:hypothetical protein
MMQVMLRRNRTLLSKREIDRQYPYQVEIVIAPHAGLWARLGAIDNFLAQKGWEHARRGDRTVGVKDAVRWCFADQAHADAFAVEFHGERHDAGHHPDTSRA